MSDDIRKPHIDFEVWLADLTYTGQDTQSLGADTFPLGIGCIATYAETQLDFSSPIRLFRYPEKLNQALCQSGIPKVLGFSNYVWNSELSLAIARRIKEIKPETIVVMGGPNYPLEEDKQHDYLVEHPEIDFYVVHEGEVTFTQLIKSLNENNRDIELLKGQLPSIHSINKKGEFLASPIYAPRIKRLDEVPSPYLTGKFDEFFDGKLWPLLQTKRGCPFTCTFCTEGLDYYAKISRFPVEFIQQEIEYIGKKMAKLREEGGRSDLYIADSNFGMFKEDIETATALSNSQKEYGWPDFINTSTGKNRKERVLKVAKIVNGQMGLSGSVQSLDLEVLENIQRKNISPEQLMELAKEAKNVDANSYCEIILGLPGETKDSHFKTLQSAVDAGFNKIVPYQLMILKGSELGSKKTVKEFGLKYQSRVLPRAFGTYEILGQKIKVADIEEVCVESKDLSYEDYLECRTMHLIITIFHNDVIFATVLKALKDYGMSVFRWLELISESIFKEENEIKRVFLDFQAHTGGELWKDRKELKTFIQQPGTIERYTNGEIGFNLLYTFKAEALTLHLDELAKVVKIATLNLLYESKLDQMPHTIDFFNTAVLWDVSRATNIIKDTHIPVTSEFPYDIPKFLNTFESENISDYFLEFPMEVRLKLSEVQRDYVKRNLAIFGDDSRGIGRLMSTAHTSKLLRHASTAS